MFVEKPSVWNNESDRSVCLSSLRGTPHSYCHDSASLFQFPLTPESHCFMRSSEIPAFYLAVNLLQEELGVLLRCNQASNSFLESLGRVSSAKAVIRILSYCYSEKLWLRSLIAVATKPKHWNPQRLVRMQSGTFGVYLDCAERHKDMVIFGI